jgi:serine/threonine protein kinase/TolB-like protein/Flp pilus assembly protein TadD
MIGKTLAHYRILSTLGQGGTGKVYLAEDTRLHRQVALKILKRDLAEDADLLLSFEREAQALAALSHPGVVTVYSVEEAEGIHFLTMEFIAGKPLRKLLPKGGMRLDRFLEIAIPLTDALSAAHQRGITHRDLKPRNVMIGDDGRVKVVDFGLAKLRQGDGAGAKATATLFRKGEIRGTIPYLSPEQVLGGTCGPPSDVFSLGTTFYMMATGTRPFGGKNVMSIISSIVRVNPPSVGELRPDLPRQLVSIIDKCLEKKPEDRYPSALEVRNELQSLRFELEGEETTTMQRSDLDWLDDEAALPDETGTLTFSVKRRPAIAIVGALVAVVAGLTYFLTRPEPPVQPTPPSERIMLAVLPFDNLSGDPDQDFLSDGLTAEAVAHLGRLDPEQLGVIARTSTMRFKASETPVDEIAAALGVDYVLDGSVRSFEDQVRVTVELVRAEDQTNLWAQSYERDLADVFAIQADIARHVADQLSERLLGEVEIAEGERVDPAAYEALLRGWYHWNEVTPESLRESIRYFEQSTEIDPRSAEAWYGLSAAHHVQGSADFVADREAYPASKRAALRALELAPDSAEAHAALAGVYYMFEWDWELAERAFGRALELNPNSSFVRHRYALFLSSLGRADDALAEMRRAVELDPLSPLARWNLALRLNLAGHSADANAELENLIGLEPAFGSDVVQGLQHFLAGDLEAAIEQFEDAATRSDSIVRELLGYSYARTGRAVEARAVLAVMELEAQEGYVPLVGRVAILGALGDADAAFGLLDQAFDERDDALVDLKTSLLLAPLRDDARYSALLKRMNLPIG